MDHPAVLEQRGAERACGCGRGYRRGDRPRRNPPPNPSLPGRGAEAAIHQCQPPDSRERSKNILDISRQSRYKPRRRTRLLTRGRHAAGWDDAGPRVAIVQRPARQGLRGPNPDAKTINQASARLPCSCSSGMARGVRHNEPIPAAGPTRPRKWARCSRGKTGTPAKPRWPRGTRGAPAVSPAPEPSRRRGARKFPTTLPNSARCSCESRSFQRRALHSEAAGSCFRRSTVGLRNAPCAPAKAGALATSVPHSPALRPSPEHAICDAAPIVALASCPLTSNLGKMKGAQAERVSCGARKP